MNWAVWNRWYSASFLVIVSEMLCCVWLVITVTLLSLFGVLISFTEVEVEVEESPLFTSMKNVYLSVFCECECASNRKPAYHHLLLRMRSTTLRHRYKISSMLMTMISSVLKCWLRNARCYLDTYKCIFNWHSLPLKWTYLKITNS